jgi:hypothetical protein
LPPLQCALAAACSVACWLRVRRSWRQRLELGGVVVKAQLWRVTGSCCVCVDMKSTVQAFWPAWHAACICHAARRPVLPLPLPRVTKDPGEPRGGPFARRQAKAAAALRFPPRPAPQPAGRP